MNFKNHLALESLTFLSCLEPLISPLSVIILRGRKVGRGSANEKERQGDLKGPTLKHERFLCLVSPPEPGLNYSLGAPKLFSGPSCLSQDSPIASPWLISLRSGRSFQDYCAHQARHPPSLGHIGPFPRFNPLNDLATNSVLCLSHSEAALRPAALSPSF